MTTHRITHHGITGPISITTITCTIAEAITTANNMTPDTLIWRVSCVGGSDEHHQGWRYADMATPEGMPVITIATLIP